MSALLESMRLRHNPFEPAATGAPVEADLWLPSTWRTELEALLDRLATAQGAKACAISGSYGSGKTYVLQWLLRTGLPARRIKAFYFDNPRTEFYGLANQLLRAVGRKDFAKCIWELAAPHVASYQRALFANGYEEYLRARASGRRGAARVPDDLQEAIRKAGVTQDEEIAHRLARLVAETAVKPYFEYRDFVAGSTGTLVAEGEEAKYFAAILRVLRMASGIESMAFLVDEFEEISLQKALSRREAHDYLATLKRLINLTRDENLWLFLAMTPDAVEKSMELEPALFERFASPGQYHFQLPPLSADEAGELVRQRLAKARAPDGAVPSPSFPFPEGFETMLRPTTISSPRRLVKVSFFALAEGAGVELPLTREHLQRVEEMAYPASPAGEPQWQ